MNITEAFPEAEQEIKFQMKEVHFYFSIFPEKN